MLPLDQIPPAKKPSATAARIALWAALTLTACDQHRDPRHTEDPEGFSSSFVNTISSDSGTEGNDAAIELPGYDQIERAFVNAVAFGNREQALRLLGQIAPEHPRDTYTNTFSEIISSCGTRDACDLPTNDQLSIGMGTDGYRRSFSSFLMGQVILSALSLRGFNGEKERFVHITENILDHLSNQPVWQVRDGISGQTRAARENILARFTNLLYVLKKTDVTQQDAHFAIEELAHSFERYKHLERTTQADYTGYD